MVINRNEFLNRAYKRNHILYTTMGNLELRDNSCDSEIPLTIGMDNGEVIINIANFVLNHSEIGYHLEYIGDRPLGVHPQHFLSLVKYGYALLEAGYPEFDKGD